MQHSDRRFFAWISWSLELETPSKIHDSQKSIYQLMHSVLKCRELWIIYVYNWRFLKLKLILAFDIQVHCFRNLELPTRDQPGVWPLFWQVGEAIQSAAGKTLSQRWFYPLGPINDLVPCTAMYLEMFGRALSILSYLVCVLIWAFWKGHGNELIIWVNDEYIQCIYIYTQIHLCSRSQQLLPATTVPLWSFYLLLVSCDLLTHPADVTSMSLSIYPCCGWLNPWRLVLHMDEQPPA